MSATDWDTLVERNKNEEYGAGWFPDNPANDCPKTLVGTVRTYNQGPLSEFTGECPWICTVEDRDEKLWSVWLNKTVLISEFERHRPMPGERIVIRYRGRAEKASRTGAQPAHLYTVTVDREQALPAFLTDSSERPALNEPDVPIDNAELPAPPPVADAEVIEDDDRIPF